MNIQKIIKLVALMAVLAFGPFFTRPALAQPGVTVPVQTFYDELAPYGQWLPSPNYGSVWVPNVGPDFQPYATNGHWVITEFGNTWVSDYAWGWAPFHYGRWYFDQQYGWAWVPDSEWGPAWVSWRTGGGYYGWAPLAPGWDINVNINIPAPYWTFVPQIYITSPSLYSYRVPRPNVVTIYQNTTIINNVYRSNNRAYIYGPSRAEIARITRRDVPVYRIDRMDRPGRSIVGNGSVGFYRPGPSNGYGSAYGRNDRFDNAPRSNYDGNAASNRRYYDNNNGRYDGNRNNDNNSGRYTGNRYNENNTPGRNYAAPNDAPNRDRGSYGGNYPADRNGNGNSVNTPAPNSAPNDRPQSDRFESSRGSYSPGNAQPGNYTPNSSPQGWEPRAGAGHTERQGQMNSQPMQGNRGEGGFQRTPDNRSGQSQPQPAQRSNGWGGQGGRGPR
ncbi:DUF6600 domain-containing protein [Spirosoma koreense]